MRYFILTLATLLGLSLSSHANFNKPGAFEYNESTSNLKLFNETPGETWVYYGRVFIDNGNKNRGGSNYPAYAYDCLALAFVKPTMSGKRVNYIHKMWASVNGSCQYGSYHNRGMNVPACLVGKTSLTRNTNAMTPKA